MTLLAARADEQIANEVTQPMRSISSTTSAVNPVNAVTKVNAVKNPASAVGGRSDLELVGTAAIRISATAPEFTF